MASRDAAVLRALEDAWMVYPDGAPVAWLARRLGHDAASRIPGPDLMPAVLGRGRVAGLRHFLFGSSESGLRALEQQIADRFPGANVVGTCAPPFGEIDGSHLAVIAAAEPHVVWCGLGAPKQELWMARYAHEAAPAVFAGVGAAFDFLAGSKERAPSWAQEYGLEWLHRFWSEPRRLGPRYLATNTRFVLDVGRGFVQGEHEDPSRP